MFSKVTQHYNTPCMLACWREINVSLKQNNNWAWLTRNVSFDSQVMLESHEILTLRQQLAESLAEKTTTTIQNLIQSVVQIPNFIDLSFESAHLSFFNVMLNWNERFIYPLWCWIPSIRVLFHFVHSPNWSFKHICVWLSSTFVINIASTFFKFCLICFNEL
jgi:hypothetical protein